MDSMKLRLILMGCILTVLGVILLVVRRFSTAFIGIIVIGIVLAIVGVVWKPRKKADNVPHKRVLNECLFWGKQEKN